MAGAADDAPCRASDPYQPADVPYLHGRVRMIDAGAYTGDTWASFPPTPGCLPGLEPDPHNHRQLLETLLDAGAQGAAALPLAAWHQREILRFTSDDAAGHVTADGFPVQAMPLDDWQAWRPTLIKMDIEGAEPEASRAHAPCWPAAARWPSRPTTTPPTSGPCLR